MSRYSFIFLIVVSQMLLAFETCSASSKKVLERNVIFWHTPQVVVPSEIDVGDLYTPAEEHGANFPIARMFSVESKLSELEKLRFNDNGSKSFETIYMDELDYLSLKALSNDLQKWFDLPAQSKTQVIELCLNLLNKFDQETRIYKELFAIYLWILFDLDKYREVIDASKDKRLYFRDIQSLKFDEYQKLRIWWAQAKALSYMRMYDESKNVYELVLTSLEKLELDTEYWQVNVEQVRSGLGHIHTQIGQQSNNKKDLDFGYKILLQAEQNLRPFAKKYPLAMARLNNYKWSYHAQLLNPVLSEASALASIKYYKLAKRQTEELSHSLNNLYLHYTWFGPANNAFKTITEALELDRSGEGSVKRAFLTNNLASSYMELGDYKLAEVNLLQSLAVFESEKMSWAVAWTQAKLGSVYRNLSEELDITKRNARLDEALNLHLKAGEFFLYGDSKRASSSLPRKDDLPVYRNRYVRLQHELVLDYLALNKPEYANRVIKKIEKSLGENTNETDEFLPNYLENAISRLQYYSKYGSEESYDSLYENVSKILAGYKTNTFVNLRLALVGTKLDFELRNKSYSSAEKTVQNIFKLAAIYRKQLDSDYLGPKWSNFQSKVIAKYIEAIIERPKQISKQNFEVRLFDLLETQQALSLRQSMRVNAFPAAELEGEISNAITTSAKRDKELINDSDKTTKNFSVSRAAHSRLRIASLKTHEKVFEIDFLRLEQIRKRLNTKQSIIRYFVTRHVSFALLISKSEIEYYPLPNALELHSIIEKYTNSVKRQSKRHSILAKQLSDVIGIKSETLKTSNELILVLDGPLHFLPFDALNLASQHDQYLPASSKYNIVVTPSLSEYFASAPSARKPVFLNDISIFSDPIFNVEDLNNISEMDSSAVAFRNWTSSLERLPGTAQEARAISEIFKNKKLSLADKNDATSSMLLSEELRLSKVLHIATHGYFNPELPSVVGLATTKNSDAHSGSSGFLSFAELLNHQFPSNLVVVSGCETSLGEVYGGEGINGLSRGLLSRGASAVLATIWSIPDEPTALFMRKFYESLKLNNGNASKSLSEVKRIFAENDSYYHPFYWAGFTLNSVDQLALKNVFR